MRVTVELTVVCTIDDPFRVLETARKVVRETKSPEEWETYFPGSPSAAMPLLIRYAIASDLLEMEGVTLHEIGERVSSLDM